jgi:subtilisin family serine protease
VKVFSGASLSTPVSKVVCGLNWIDAQNDAVPGTIDVVNLSLAYPGSSRALKRAVARVRDSGAVVVAAAGNNYGGALQAPARFKGVISVSALAGKTLAYFSAKGADMTAPGVNVKSPENGGGFSLRSGTSRSAPMVAGAAAIVLEGDPGATEADVLALLRSSGRCPNGETNADPGFCGGRWKGDDRNAEPQANAYCAGVWADLLFSDPDCGD